MRSVRRGDEWPEEASQMSLLCNQYRNESIKINYIEIDAIGSKSSWRVKFKIFEKLSELKLEAGSIIAAAREAK